MDESSLRNLRSLGFLESWPPSVAPDRVAAVRRILESLVEEISARVGDPTFDSASRIREAVLALNVVDTGFICTIEREDLCDYFFAVGNAAGSPHQDVQAAVDLRDW